jgi:hypothetical protein
MILEPQIRLQGGRNANTVLAAQLPNRWYWISQAKSPLPYLQLEALRQIQIKRRFADIGFHAARLTQPDYQFICTGQIFTNLHLLWFDSPR